MTDENRMTPLKWAGAILLLPLVIPIALLFGVVHAAKAVTLHTLLLALWAPGDRRVLFVYSNSPNWQDYSGHSDPLEFSDSGGHFAKRNTESRTISSG
jgi:hypothetical protein